MMVVIEVDVMGVLMLQSTSAVTQSNTLAFLRLVLIHEGSALSWLSAGETYLICVGYFPPLCEAATAIVKGERVGSC